MCSPSPLDHRACSTPTRPVEAHNIFLWRKMVQATCTDNRSLVSLETTPTLKTKDHVTDTTSSPSTLLLRRKGNPPGTPTAPTTVDMANHTTPRHKAIILKVMVLLRTGVTATTAVVRARLAKGNPGSIAPQDHPRRKEDAPRVNHPSILLVSHPESRSRSALPTLYSVFRIRSGH